MRNQVTKILSWAEAEPLLRNALDALNSVPWEDSWLLESGETVQKRIVAKRGVRRLLDRWEKNDLPYIPWSEAEPVLRAVSEALDDKFPPNTVWLYAKQKTKRLIAEMEVEA
jgi:hypothetical protein